MTDDFDTIYSAPKQYLAFCKISATSPQEYGIFFVGQDENGVIVGEQEVLRSKDAGELKMFYDLMVKWINSMGVNSPTFVEMIKKL